MKCNNTICIFFNFFKTFERGLKLPNPPDLLYVLFIKTYFTFTQWKKMMQHIKTIKYLNTKNFNLNKNAC